MKPPEPPESNELPTSCEDVLDLLHCLIENELEDDEAEAVLTHLAGCKPCRQALSEHIKLRGLLVTNMPHLSKIHFSAYRPTYH